MTDSVFQLKEVVARGTQAVSPHQTISQEQLSALASNNVADALKYLAGVQIKDYGFTSTAYASPMRRTVPWTSANTR